MYNRIVGDMQIHHPAAVDGFHTIANINSAASRARRKRKRSEANNNYDKVEDHIQLALAAHNEHVVAISNEPHQNQDQMEFVNINQRSPSYAVGLPQEPSLDSLNTLNQAEAQIQNQNHGQSQLDALNVVPSANGGTYLNTPLLGGVYDNRTGDCDMENYVHTETI